MRILTFVARLPALLLMGLIRLYQVTISPLIGPTCKYYPSCSHYGLEAVRRHGALRGTVLAGWRVLRCNPWSHGGVVHDGKFRPIDIHLAVGAVSAKRLAHPRLGQ